MYIENILTVDGKHGRIPIRFSQKETILVFHSTYLVVRIAKNEETFPVILPRSSKIRATLIGLLQRSSIDVKCRNGFSLILVPSKAADLHFFVCVDMAKSNIQNTTKKR